VWCPRNAETNSKETGIDYKTLIAIDSYLLRNCDTKMEVLGSVRDMLMESRMMCGVGVCSSDGRWEKLIKFVKGLCKKMLILNVNFTCTLY